MLAAWHGKVALNARAAPEQTSVCGESHVPRLRHTHRHVSAVTSRRAARTGTCEGRGGVRHVPGVPRATFGVFSWHCHSVWYASRPIVRRLIYVRLFPPCYPDTPGIAIILHALQKTYIYFVLNFIQMCQTSSVMVVASTVASSLFIQHHPM